MVSAVDIRFAGQGFMADSRRALYWQDKCALIVADLHIGKGADFSPRGTLLPPYEMQDIHDRLMQLIADYAPRRVIALGDSFHRVHSSAQLGDREKSLLDALLEKTDWLFIEGNHDAGGFSGGYSVAPDLREEGILFTHQPKSRQGGDAAVFGHYHPKFSRGDRRSGRMTRPCFIWDDSSLILPAFGTYTGGMDVGHDAIRKYFSGPHFIATADTHPRPAIFKNAFA